MEEVVNEIRDTKTKLAIAEREGDASSRDFLRTYLVELQKKENLLLQQQIQQATPPVQGIEQGPRVIRNNVAFNYGLENDDMKQHASFACNGTIGDVAKFISDDIKDLKKGGVNLSTSPTMVPLLSTSVKLEEIPEDTIIYFTAKWVMSHPCAVVYLFSLGVCATFFTIAALLENLLSPKNFGPVMTITVTLSIGMFYMISTCAGPTIHFLKAVLSNRFIRWEFVAYVLIVTLVFTDIVILAEFNIFIAISKILSIGNTYN